VRGSPVQCSEAALAFRWAIVSEDLQIVKPAQGEIRRVGSEAGLGREQIVVVDADPFPALCAIERWKLLRAKEEPGPSWIDGDPQRIRTSIPRVVASPLAVPASKTSACSAKSPRNPGNAGMRSGK
jgi:hypothetical protein